MNIYIYIYKHKYLYIYIYNIHIHIYLYTYHRVSEGIKEYSEILFLFIYIP